MRWLCLLLAFLTPAWATPLQFGVLAFRPKPQTLKQWQPLADYLGSALGLPVELRAYDYKELETAIGQHAVDVVLTNSSHYVLLKQRYDLSAPLVTVVNAQAGHVLKAYGGVIFARADDAQINQLADLAGKRIATVFSGSFAGYQMQAYELLEAHLSLPRHLLVTGMPHDRAVEAVLSGRADAGFVRSGVLESMQREGRLNLARLKIIHRQSLPDYPHISSTRLYPEWPLAVLPQVSEPLATRLAVALLSLPPDAARAANIHGFSIPADYSGVEDVLRQLRLPPFDTPPTFTLADLWHKYSYWIVALGVLITLLGTSLLAVLLIFRRSQASEARFRLLFQRNNAAMLLVEPEGGAIVDANAAASSFYGWPHDELCRLNIQDINQLAPEEIEAERSLAAQQVRNYYVFPHRLADGSIRTVEMHASPIQVGNRALLFSIIHDITRRMEAEERLASLLAEQKAILENELFCILKTRNRLIVWANPGFERMLGYAHGELDATSTARLFASQEAYETLGQTAYPIMSAQGFFQSQIEGVRKDGSHIWVNVVATMLNQDETLWGFVDLTERIRVELDLEEREALLEEAQAIAHLGSWHVVFGQNGGEDRWTVSKELRRLYSYTDDRPISTQSGFDAMHPDDREAVSRAWLAAQAGIGPLEWMHRIVVDGAIKWIQVSARYIRDDRGTPIEASGTNQDITERKKVEEQLRLAASVFTHAREGIFITDADSNIVDANETFTQITGYRRDEVLGRNPRILGSGRQDPDFYATMWHSLVSKGYWQGEIWNRRKEGDFYAEMLTISAVRDTEGITRSYVALFSDVTEQKEQQRHIEHIAHYDALTGLPNRVLLADRLHQSMAKSMRHGQLLAVAYLDLDGFKAINDNHGHEMGDQLLMAVARRIKLAVRDGDTVARLGGDEFVAVLDDLVDIENSVPLLLRLLAAASQPVQVEALSLQVSASIGVTFYPQEEGVDADQLLRQADQAMYQAKLTGKNRYHVFDAEQDRSVRCHHESLEHIQIALSQDEFVLYYQPKVNLRSGKVVGAEALIRWLHPERGLLSPASFLPLIEGHPLAVELGEWVIDSALTQMEIWHAAGLDLPVSVNVGARQLQQENFVDRLRAALAAHPNIESHCLELEVLETSALKDLAQVSRVIEDCREIGVHFALDDFGTGYSSLTYLKRLPADVLKIDQSFVHDMLEDPDDLAIVEGVLGLATAFRRQVIAEGVETVAHGELLLQLGCELAQGYGIARPMPASELPTWAATWKPHADWENRSSLDHDDMAVLYAAVEHRAWVAAIEKFLRGEREAPPTMDHHQCRFGQWLKGAVGSTDRPDLQIIVTLHCEIHAKGTALLELSTQGQAGDLGELRELRDALLERLRALTRESEQRHTASRS